MTRVDSTGGTDLNRGALSLILAPRDVLAGSVGGLQGESPVAEVEVNLHGLALRVPGRTGFEGPLGK